MAIAERRIMRINVGKWEEVLEMEREFEKTVIRILSHREPISWHFQESLIWQTDCSNL